MERASGQPTEARVRHTTIRDVARHAHVGIGTVSRVLNSRANVSDATRKHVQASIRRLGFRPHAQARRILRRHAEMVCFLLSNRDVLHSFHARILQGVEHYARGLKQHVVFGAVFYDEAVRPNRILLPPLLEERGWVDGLILAGTIYPNFLRRIQRIGIPFVALGNNVFSLENQHRHFDQVSFDGETGESEAVRHVLDQGHRLIAFVADTSYPWFRERHQGYLSALEAHHLAGICLTEHRQPNFVEYGEWAGPKLLERNPRPTAMMAGNDEIAYGLWRCFRRMGIRVPEDISLVGFDDREEALLMDPPLTTVRVHKEEIGRACMKVLLERLHHPSMPFTQRILLTELIIRGTVKRL